MQKKKAGIVAVVSAAALLGLGPLAFAGDEHGNIDKGAEGIVAGLNGNDGNVAGQGCNNNVPINVLGVQVPVEDGAGGNGLTGAGNGEAESGDSTTDQSDACGQESGAGDTVSR